MKIRAALLAFALGVLPVVTASPSHASGCVTKAEYKKLKNGMSQAKVKKIFGTNGSVLSQSSGYGISIVMRQYSTCSPYAYGNVTIMFQNNGLTTRAAVWI